MQSGVCVFIRPTNIRFNNCINDTKYLHTFCVCLKDHLNAHTDLNSSLTLCIGDTPKRVILQTVKTQMKCSIDMNYGLSQVYCIKPEGRIHSYTMS